MTPTEEWFYCDWEKDDEACDGPVSLEKLAELIRTEAIPHDALISKTKAEWTHADRMETVLRAIPVDRERIVREFIYYGETEHPDWGWASDRMYAMLEGAPEIAWEIILELVERAPSEDSLSYFAAGRPASCAAWE